MELRNSFQFSDSLSLCLRLWPWRNHLLFMVMARRCRKNIDRHAITHATIFQNKNTAERKTMLFYSIAEKNINKV